MGYFQEIGPYGEITEGNTFTCAHCNDPIEIRRGMAFNMCHIEHRRVCDGCHRKGICDPFEKKLERIESRASILKAAGIEP